MKIKHMKSKFHGLLAGTRFFTVCGFMDTLSCATPSQVADSPTRRNHRSSRSDVNHGSRNVHDGSLSHVQIDRYSHKNLPVKVCIRVSLHCIPRCRLSQSSL